MKKAFFKHFTKAIISNTNHKPYDMAYYVPTWHSLLPYLYKKQTYVEEKNMYIFNKLTLEIMLVDFYDKKLLPRGERKKKKGKNREQIV